jgi:hypothetical protein
MSDVVKLPTEVVARHLAARREAWNQAMVAYDRAKKEARWAAMKAEDAWALVCKFAEDDFTEGTGTEVRQ